MNKQVLRVLRFVFCAVSPSAFALDLSMLDQPAFEKMSKDLSASMSYKAVAPMETLHLTGFDVGADLTMTRIESSDVWVGALGLSALPILPLAKLHVHKGLVYGFDIAGVYLPKTKGLGFWGGELRYTYDADLPFVPALGARLTYTRSKDVDGLDLKTRGVELGVSKKLGIFIPYAAMGKIRVNSIPLGDAASARGLSVANSWQTKYNVGMGFGLGLMSVAFDWDRTSGVDSLSGKVGFRW